MNDRARGQASIELFAVIPALVLVGLLAWQLMAVIAAGLSAQEQVRAQAFRTTAAGSGRTIVVSATVAVPTVIPGVSGLSMAARVGVRTP